MKPYARGRKAMHTEAADKASAEEVQIIARADTHSGTNHTEIRIIYT